MIFISYIKSIPKLLVVFLALSIFIRLSFAFFSDDLDGDDGFRYLITAKNMVEFHVFSNYGDYKTPTTTVRGVLQPGYINPLSFGKNPENSIPPTAHDMPGYPTLLALVYLITNSTILTGHIASVINVFLFAILILLTYSISLHLGFSSKDAAFAAAILAFLPDTFVFGTFYMPDTIFTLLLYISFLFVLRIQTKSHLKYFISSAILVSVSMLFKPIAILFSFVYGLFLAINKKYKEALILTALCLLFQGLVLTPWIFRNHKVFDQATISTVSGYNLYYYNYRFVLKASGVRNVSEYLAETFEEIKNREGDKWNDLFDMYQCLGDYASKKIREKPFYLIKSSLTHLPRLFVGTGTKELGDMLGIDSAPLDIKQHSSSFGGLKSYFKSMPTTLIVIQLSSWLFLGIIYLASATGAVKLFISKEWKTYVLLLLTFLYFFVIYNNNVSTRYRFPLDPLIAILAAPTISLLLEKVKQRFFRKADTQTIHNNKNLL